MSEAHMRIAILGGSGHINRRLIEVIEPVASSLQIKATILIISRSAAERCAPSSTSSVSIDYAVGSVLEPNAELLELFQVRSIDRVFFCLPQSLSSTEMLSASNAFTDLVYGTIRTVVRISSFGIDESYPPQGALALAHKQGEDYMRMKGLTITSIRPTSFFSNFATHDLPSIKASNSIFSPLGFDSVAVNWISTQDIAEVSANCLLNDSLDGKILELTGDINNLYTIEKICSVVAEFTGKQCKYNEIPIPESRDYRELWEYLRAGGFNCVTGTFQEVLGSHRRPILFSDYIRDALSEL